MGPIDTPNAVAIAGDRGHGQFKERERSIQRGSDASTGRLDSTGTICVNIVAIDPFVQLGGYTPSLIKMDVEGGEARDSLGVPGECLATPQFVPQAPDEYASRDQLDHAVERECRQHQTPGDHARRDRDKRLDYPPGKCQPFQAERLLNQDRPRWDLRQAFAESRGRPVRSVPLDPSWS
jgi:hypothetical protein